ncbi:MarR family winged helix-turn-helix transcriptional regulator [Colwellia sp. MEBiC06753]
MALLDLTQFFPYQLSILQSHVARLVGAYYQQACGLNRNQWCVMAVLAMQDKMTAKELCQFTQLEKMPISRALKQLEALAYVERTHDQQDLRCSRFSLTNNGVKRYQDILPNVMASNHEILAVLTTEQQQQLRTITNKLLSHVQQLSHDKNIA